MSPRPFLSNAIYRRFRDSKSLGDVLCSLVQRRNAQNYILSKFRVVLSRAARHQSHSRRMLYIFGWRDVFEIDRPIVSLDSVLVVDLISVRKRSNKGQRDQTMNEPRVLPLVPGQDDAFISLWRQFDPSRWPRQVIRVLSSHMAEIRHFIHRREQRLRKWSPTLARLLNVRFIRVRQVSPRLARTDIVDSVWADAKLIRKYFLTQVTTSYLANLFCAEFGFAVQFSRMSFWHDPIIPGLSNWSQA